jgi:Na+-driven multidrug efflux pump
MKFLKRCSILFPDWYVSCLGVNLILVIIGTLNDLDLFCAWVIYFNLAR